MLRVVGSFTLPKRLRPLQSPLDRVKAADPLLMAAAIAYNAFFALVPLAIAAVVAVSMLGGSGESLARLEDFLDDVFPPEVATFVGDILEEASELVGDWQGPVIAISLLVALYSGSRGIYAVQKALRQIQGVEEDRPYWHARGLGILFTLGAGVALVGGYLILLFGQFFADLLERYGLSLGSMTGLSTGMLIAWVMLFLWAIYRWGTPVPFPRSFLSALAATVIIVLMTWLAAFFIPSLGSNTLAVLGTVGIVLIWLFALGFVVVVVPAFAAPAEAVIRGVE